MWIRRIVLGACVALMPTLSGCVLLAVLACGPQGVETDCRAPDHHQEPPPGVSHLWWQCVISGSTHCEQYLEDRPTAGGDAGGPADLSGGEDGGPAGPSGEARRRMLDEAGIRYPVRSRWQALLYPGGGHLYTGETRRGAALLGGAAGALVAGALLSSGGGECRDASGRACEYDPGRHELSEPADRTPLLLGAAVATGLWAFGVLDADDSAERANLREDPTRRAGRLQVGPRLGVDRDGTLRAGVELRLPR